MFSGYTQEKKRGIFFVVVIWNLPLKQRCCCCCFLFISKILFCYYVVGISLYFYNSFFVLFRLHFITLCSSLWFKPLVKIQIISVRWFLFFNLLSFVLLLITHIVSVFLSKTHTRARRKILQIGHGSTNSTSGCAIFNIFGCVFVCVISRLRATASLSFYLFSLLCLCMFSFLFVFS